MDIQWTKIYKQVSEGEYANSIIAVFKYPVEFGFIDHGEKGETIVTKWEYRVFIDLWIIKIRFKYEKGMFAMLWKRLLDRIRGRGVGNA